MVRITSERGQRRYHGFALGSSCYRSLGKGGVSGGAQLVAICNHTTRCRQILHTVPLICQHIQRIKEQGPFVCTASPHQCLIIMPKNHAIKLRYIIEEVETPVTLQKFAAATRFTFCLLTEKLSLSYPYNCCHWSLHRHEEPTTECNKLTPASLNSFSLPTRQILPIGQRPSASETDTLRHPLATVWRTNRAFN